MFKEFKVSVIIPVYNAEKFLRKAVCSAEALEEVGEVILIEDSSPDNALTVALGLQEEFHKVILYQHFDKGNHGAGASRNLGIKKATYEYIAFLDADDFYLPDRFKIDKLVFAENPDCDGVYSCVGSYFYSEEAREQFFEKGFGYQETLTLSGSVQPEKLFSVLFYANDNVRGEFCTDGITLKKTVFTKVGDFNTELRLRQDIHLWKRLAGFCRLYPGQISKPTAMRGIHSNNRMTHIKDQEKYTDLWWNSLQAEFKSRKLVKEKYEIFEQAYFNYLVKSSNKILAFLAFLHNALKYPEIAKKSYGIFDFNFWKVFGKNWITIHLISLKNRLLS